MEKGGWYYDDTKRIVIQKFTNNSCWWKFRNSFKRSRKKSIVERYIQFSFDEVEVSQICRWLGVWFPNITDRKVNHINFLEYIERGKKYLEVVLNYNDYTFFSETITYDEKVIEKIREVL